MVGKCFVSLQSCRLKVKRRELGGLSCWLCFWSGELESKTVRPKKGVGPVAVGSEGEFDLNYLGV